MKDELGMYEKTSDRTFVSRCTNPPEHYPEHFVTFCEFYVVIFVSQCFLSRHFVSFSEILTHNLMRISRYVQLNLYFMKPSRYFGKIKYHFFITDTFF